MRFKIDGNIRTKIPPPPPLAEVRVPASPSLTDLEKEHICRGCAEFKDTLHLPRCNAKCKVCPGSSARLRPWRNMPLCPKNLWTRLAQPDTTSTTKTTN